MLKGLCLNILGLIMLCQVMIGLSGPICHAADGRLPIYEPTTISNMGSYYLTDDVFGTLYISSGELTIDLRGHFVVSIIVTDAYSSIRITNGIVAADIDLGNGGRTMIIDNCTIFGGMILADQVEDIVIEHNVVSGISLSNCTYGQIRQNHVSKSYNDGIKLLNCSHYDITNNTVTDNDSIGINLENSSYNTLRDNHVTNNGWYGFNLTGGSQSNTLDRNTTSSNAGHGILLISSNRNRIVNNTVIRNIADPGSASGIYIVSSQYCTVSYNHISENELKGLFLDGASYCMIDHNHISNGGGVLVRINSNYNTLDWNTSSDNYMGFEFDASTVGNVYSYNRALGTMTHYGDLGTNIPVFYDAAATAPTNQ